MPVTHGLRFQETQFWVIHRQREYGPFDYEWSRDLGGIELIYQGQKFGEFCSPDAISADLKEFGLPMTVVEVASIVLGCMVHGIVTGEDISARNQMLTEQLRSAGYERFVPGGE